MADKTPKFTFQHLDGKKFLSLESKDSQELLLKWSMQGRISAQTFSFDQAFQAYQKDDFVLAFMQDQQVIHHLKVLSSSGSWCPVGVEATVVTADPVACSVLSMSFFDRLQENNITHESGKISKCLDDYHGDIVISDELRKCLLDDESDNYDIFSDTERDEFLFRLFQHFCLGGSVCQFEDSIQPYLDLTKLVYKDLISVQKDPNSGDLHITSLIFKITAMDDASKYFPSDGEHIQDFGYLIVDPMKRHVTAFYHKFGAAAFK